MRVFVLTGAGVSAESGLGTFRDPGGIWAQLRPDDSSRRRRPSPATRPACTPSTTCAAATCWPPGRTPPTPRSPGSRPRSRSAAAALFLCTQNIDDLHEQAGSRAVHHMHGELLQGALRLGAARREDCRGDLVGRTTCDGCGRPARMRPDVVWFGEMPRGMDRIEAALAAADRFVADRHLRRGLPRRRLRRRGARRSASRPSSSTSLRPTTPQRLRRRPLRPRDRGGAGLRRPAVLRRGPRRRLTACGSPARPSSGGNTGIVPGCRTGTRPNLASAQAFA